MARFVGAFVLLLSLVGIARADGVARLVLVVGNNHPADATQAPLRYADDAGCLCERREVLEGDAKVGEYCFARGIGKVFEETRSEHEGLIDACIGGLDLRGEDCGQCPAACVPDAGCECPSES